MLVLAGVAVLLMTPLSAAPRLLLTATWLALGIGELWRSFAYYQRTRQLRLYSDGSIDIIGTDGSVANGEFAPGSLVTARFAWLCIRDAGGRHACELLTGNTRKSSEWRRFQVICRHLAPC